MFPRSDARLARYRRSRREIDLAQVEAVALGGAVSGRRAPLVQRSRFEPIEALAGAVRDLQREGARDEVPVEVVVPTEGVERYDDRRGERAGFETQAEGAEPFVAGIAAHAPARSEVAEHREEEGAAPDRRADDSVLGEELEPGVVRLEAAPPLIRVGEVGLFGRHARIVHRTDAHQRMLLPR